MWNPPALTPTEDQLDQDSVTTKPSGADDGANSSGPNAMLSPSFNALEFDDFPQRDIQVQRDSLLNPCDSNRDSDVPYAGYPIKAHGAEAKNIRITSLPMPLGDNFGARGNTNTVHANSLNLGIGGGAEVKSNHNFSTREITSKLKDPVSISSSYKSSMVGQRPMNPLNLAQFTGLTMRGQTNGDGLSRPALAGSSRLNMIQFPGLDSHQANPQYNFSGIYNDFLSDQTPSSSPIGIPMIHQRGHVTQSPLGPQISRPTSHASQFVHWQQGYSNRSSASASSGTLMNFLSARQGGNSISHAQLGTLNPLTEAWRTQNTSGVRTPGSVGPVGSTITGVANIWSPPSSAQPVVHSATSPNLRSVAALGNSLFSVPRVNNIQSTAAAGPLNSFPRRLGVHPNHSTARDTLALRLSAQANLVRPLHSDTLALRLPAQANLVRPLHSGHHHPHGMLAQLPTEFPRPVNSSGVHLPGHAHPIRPLVSSGQVTPVAKPTRPQGSLVSHTPLKRRATENLSTALVSQRRKIFHQPVATSHNAPGQRPSLLSRSHILPAHVHHIKWQGFDEPRKPSGYKCLLCKRDLSFTAEGQVYQPAIPPVVAVLPCGHTFHDECLQRITPKEQSKEPPCIPCALGET